ncbi:MAG: acyl carrier protein [Culturomica sp.]|jgi:acyl carrier protein|nr:acyl carrier protein [Culturomica sp.]
MEITQFIEKFAEQFEETPRSIFAATTDFKSLDEWDSLVSLSVISMVDEELGKRITGADIRSCTTIEDLYNLVMSK